MKKNKMDITLIGCNYKKKGLWYLDEELLQMLADMTNKLGSLQCTYQDHIIVQSKEGRAVFDTNGKLSELYDMRQSQNGVRVEPSSHKELEFEMILLFSKINE